MGLIANNFVDLSKQKPVKKALPPTPKKEPVIEIKAGPEEPKGLFVRRDSQFLSDMLDS